MCAFTKDAVPVEDVDAVAAELIADHLLFVIDHLRRAPEKVVDRDFALEAPGASVDAVRHAGELDDGRAQCRRGNGAGSRGHAAESALAVDDRGRFPSFAAWTAAR